MNLIFGTKMTCLSLLILMALNRMVTILMAYIAIMIIKSMLKDKFSKRPNFDRRNNVKGSKNMDETQVIS